MNRLLCCLHRFEKLNRLACVVGESPMAAPATDVDPVEAELDRQEREKGSAEADNARQAEIDESEWKGANLSRQIELRDGQHEEGEAIEYVNTFKNSPELVRIHTAMRDNRNREGANGLNDFTLWRAHREDVVSLFDDMNGTVLMPLGKGRKAFVEGLKAPPNTPMWQASDDVLAKIIDNLQARVDAENMAKAALEKQSKTPLQGHTLNGYVNNFKNSWNRASPTESLLIAGAVGAVVFWAWGKKDDTLPFAEEMKYGDAALLAGMLGGINLLSGAFSADGKTLLNRFGTGTDVGVPDVEDPFIRNYCYEQGMADDKTMLTALTTCMNLDMRHLYDLYRDASDINTTERKIDITRLGLAPGIINGEALYKIIDKVVEKTAANQVKTKYMLEKGITDESQINRGELKEVTENALRDKSQKLAYFEDKYNRGSVGRSNQSLLQVIVNENFDPDIGHKGYKELAEKEDAKLAINRVTGGVKYAALASVDWLKDTAAPYVVEISGKFYSFMDDEVVTPSGEYLANTYNKYAPKVKEFVKERLSALEQGKLEKVMEPYLHGTVTSYAPNSGAGLVTVKGVPGFPLLDKTDETGHHYITIGEGADAEKFDGAKDIRGNKKHNDKIDAVATNKAKIAYANALLENPTATQFLANKNIKWDPTKGTWYLVGVDAPVYAEGGVAYDNKPVEALMKFDKTGKASFLINGKPLEEIENLAKDNLEAILQETIKKDTAFKPIEDLPVKILGVEPDGTSYKIKVTIGGLITYMVPRSLAGTPNNKINLGFAFINDVTGLPEPSLTALHITAANGGEEFLNTKAAQIYNSREFLNPFMSLEHVINTTDETILDRAKDGSITGPIKDRKWKTLLDFKKDEMLERYKLQLAGKSASEMDKVYTATIFNTTRELNNLESKIHSAPEEMRKDKFEGYMQELERVGYHNAGYKEMFNEYMAMIGANFKADALSWKDPLAPLNADRYEVYQDLLMIWSFNTQEYMEKDPVTGDPQNLSAATKTTIKTKIIKVIQKKLERCADGEKLTANKMIPKPTTREAAEEWVKQTN